MLSRIPVKIYRPKGKVYRPYERVYRPEENEPFAKYYAA